jgi:O-antigen ligase
MRARLPVLIALPLLLGPGLLACFSGGYFDSPRLWAGIAAWALFAVVAVALPRPLPASGPGRLALGGLAALTAWTGASLAWAPDAGAAADDLQRLLLYLPYLAAGIVVLRAPTEPLLLLAITAACGYGLSERFMPGVVDLAPVVSAGDRLAYPLTYWNASGAFAALGLILAAALAGEPGRPPALRAAAAAAGPPLALTLLLTFSRGALGALAAGLLLLLALAPGRARLAGAAIVVGGGGVAAGALVVAAGGLRTAAGAGGASGVAALAGLVAAMAACALAGRALARRRDAQIPWLRTAALAAAAVVLAGTVVAVVDTERGPGRENPSAGPQRLASVQSNRYAYWKVAVEAFADHPLHGEGSGGFRTAWLRERPFREPVRDAHSLYLETAAELGLAGLLALALLVAGCLAAARRALPAGAGAAAALAAYALHAGIDWDWEMPALTLVALALAARLIAAGEPRTPAGAAAADGRGP